MTLTLSTLVFTGVGVGAQPLQDNTSTGMFLAQAGMPQSVSPAATIPEKNVNALKNIEKKGFKYSFFKFFMAMLGVLVSAGSIFLGLKFYKNFVLKGGSSPSSKDYENSLESPKDFKETINSFLNKTDK